MKKLFASIALAIGLVPVCGLAAAPPGTELPPPGTGGVASIDALVHKLTNDRRLLIVGAHPDDENSQLLAVVSRKLGGEAAYLSLTRGEGGQNLIGDELGIGLGLIRTQELLAARRLDGARQFFTRAYDFGYSKTLDEALRFWPKATLLEDAVRVIRRFRPQIVFVTFTGTPRDGHGQHQASAVVAREAYRAAGDAAAVPLASGEAVWTPKTLLRSNWFDPEGTGFPIPTGDIDPLLGKSYLQIAVASRSLHRSQGTGAIQRPGPGDTGAIWMDGAGQDGKELFAGIDTRLRAIAAEVADPARRARLEALLDRVQAAAEEVRRRLSPATLGDAVAPLATIVRDLDEASKLVQPSDGGAAAILEEKRVAAEEALAASAGVVLDALSETETAAGGEKVAVTASVWNAGTAEVRVEALAIDAHDGWSAPAPGAARAVAPGKLEEWKLEAQSPPAPSATVPYFLVHPLDGYLYDWNGVPTAVRGEPLAPPPLLAVARATIAGAPVRLAREVTFRIRDEASGEVRHPLRAVPPVEVSVEPELLVWPIGRGGTRTVTVTVTSYATGPAEGTVVVSAPPGWPAPAAAPFALPKKGDRRVLDVALAAPAGAKPGKFPLAVAAVLAGGTRVSRAIPMIDYEHIRPTPFPHEAAVALTALDLKLPALTAVGYVRGAADRVPEALRGVGVPIEVLSNGQLERGDLSHYDAIVIGPRAYETEPALARANARLLDYARNGGLVVVQYQQYPFIQGGFAPYPLEIARPHDRVTDETVPVTLLEPNHPILRAPNPIGGADWEGWVQERGLYFAHTWDPAYTPLLQMADPGEPPQRGGLLVASVGKGRYVYTGLAFFRQLPAGVPGAYRLFANLVGWK